MAEFLSLETIWAADDISEEDVGVPQWGGKVRIRALSMRQVSSINGRATRRDPRTNREDMDRDMMVALLLTEGLIEPKVTLPEAQRLLSKSSMAVGAIVAAINRASGLTDQSVSEADKSDGEESDAGIRVLPSARVEDDARGTPSEDVLA